MDKKMPEIIVLVDEKDNPIGYEEKLAAHRDGGKLHRAFSIFIFNSKNEALLQLRAKAKHHFQSLWSNPCCSHPTKGENLEAAVHRKLKQELGFDTPLKETFSFVYKATDRKSGLTEHEFDHVFVGQYDRDPKPNPEEVDSLVSNRLQQAKKGKPRSARGLELETPVLTRSSTIASFYKLPLEERLRLVKEFAGLTSEDAQTLANGTMPSATAQRMIENVIGMFPIPLGIATNFLVNGRDYLVPMAIEEPSVVAAASNAAKMARATGGFTA